MADPLLDARGVEIAPGDTVIYGFGVGRSVAMAEAVVVNAMGDYGSTVSTTASGRVRVRVTRRSYGGGEKPVVDIAPDRLVVLKAYPHPEIIGGAPYLPPSPLPTQAEEERKKIETRIESYVADLRATEIPWWGQSFDTLDEFHAYAAKQLAKHRRKLKALEH
ncbi:hypothetical protein [Streptomyces griseus]|uniref:hypothetical protein n=1 Tax=Streptomyces griseus TaxID=1911 RepID=UPI0033E0D072